MAEEAFVLVHDAARYCVRDADITRLVELGGEAGGGLLAAPLRDTLKRAGADGGSRRPKRATPAGARLRNCSAAANWRGVAVHAPTVWW